VLVMSPSASFRHQEVLRLLLRQIESAVDRLPGVRIVLDTDIAFSANTVYRPDIALYVAGRIQGVPDRLAAVPDLAIEIVSPSSRPRDLQTKRDDYARFGVREYWVIDPPPLGDSVVRVFRLPARAGKGKLRSPKYADLTVTRGGLDSVAVPGLKIDLAKLR